MKPIFLFLSLVFLGTSCSVGVKKDLMTKLTVTNKGLSLGEAYLTSDGQKLETNEFVLGQKIKIQLEGVEGFTLKDGMAFPGASLLVEDKEGNVVLEKNDLFAELAETGVKAEDAKYLAATLDVGSPMEVGKTYIFTAHFWDINSEGEITCELEYTVK